MTLLRCSTHMYNLRPMGCDECERLTNFPRSSQNQTASSGVEGAHEGTTADKSDSREPEKLNNAHDSRYSTENMLLPCAKCGERRAHVNHYAEYGGDHNFALAESSLSSPPPTICVYRNDKLGIECDLPIGHSSDHHIKGTGRATSPELLPTQLPKEK